MYNIHFISVGDLAIFIRLLSMISACFGGQWQIRQVDENGPIGPMAEAWHLKALPTTVWDEHQGGFGAVQL